MIFYYQTQFQNTTKMWATIRMLLKPLLGRYWAAIGSLLNSYMFSMFSAVARTLSASGLKRQLCRLLLRFQEDGAQPLHQLSLEAENAAVGGSVSAGVCASADRREIPKPEAQISHCAHCFASFLLEANVEWSKR